MVRITQVGDAVHLINGDSVNWTIAGAGSGGITLFDSGYPGDRDDVLESIAALGYQPQDVQAIVLTHGHIDHMGSAIWWATEHGVPVYAHDAEVANIRRDYTDQASPLRVLLHLLRRPRAIPWALHALHKGARNRAGIATVAAIDARLADLPGNPVPFPTPGHTAGHCSFLIEGHVLVTGDAIITGHPTSSRAGPQMLPVPFSKDNAQASRSARALIDIDADILAPGHGPVWTGSLRNIIETALDC